MEIPTELYEYQLTTWINQRLSKTNDSLERSLLDFLERVTCASMEEFPVKKIDGEIDNGLITRPFIGRFKPTEADLSIIQEFALDKYANLQIRALSLDCLQQVAKDKRQLQKDASAAYLALYGKTHSPSFLLRAISVRSIKEIKDSSFVTQVSTSLLHPSWLSKYCKELRKSYTVAELSPIQNAIEFLLRKFSTPKDPANRHDERYCYTALASIGTISNRELYRQLALSYVKEVDFMNADSDEHVFHLRIPQTAQDAYNEIYKVKDVYPEDFRRIRDKLIEAQGIMLQIIEKIGVKSSMSVSENLKSKVCGLLTKDPIIQPYQLILSMIGLPFFLTAMYNDCFRGFRDSHTFLCDSFGSSILGDQGQIIGTANPKDALKISVHQWLRFNQNYVICSYLADFQKHASGWDDSFCMEDIASSCKSSYIPEERREIWADGLVSMMSGHWIAAVHILMPQIEHAFLKKTEQYFGRQTKLEGQTHQDEPSLDRCLESLKPYFQDHLYDEFHFFFTDGADTNARNRIAHGLCSPYEIQGIAPYLWWLAIKLYFCDNEIFKAC